MPIKFSSTIDVPRIKFGQSTENIRRAYLGQTLVYGLYDVHYYDRSYIDTYSPKLYAWGYKPEAVEFPKPQDWSTYFDTHWTHWGDDDGEHGWYEDNTLTIQKDKIDIDDHRDLDMYARWRQRRYAYKGVVAYDVYRYVPPGPGPGPGGDFPYTDTTPKIMYTGQCTQYCYSRSSEVFGSACVNSSYGNASTWLSSINTAEGWYNASGSSPRPGDVVVYSDGGAGHVLFIETSDYIITQSNVRYPGGSWAQYYVDNGYTDDGVHPRYNAELFSCVSVSNLNGYLGMTMLGVIRHD